MFVWRDTYGNIYVGQRENCATRCRASRWRHLGHSTKTKKVTTVGYPSTQIVAAGSVNCRQATRQAGEVECVVRVQKYSNLIRLRHSTAQKGAVRYNSTVVAFTVLLSALQENTTDVEGLRYNLELQGIRASTARFSTPKQTNRRGCAARLLLIAL